MFFRCVDAWQELRFHNDYVFPVIVREVYNERNAPRRDTVWGGPFSLLHCGDARVTKHDFEGG